MCIVSSVNCTQNVKLNCLSLSILTVFLDNNIIIWRIIKLIPGNPMSIYLVTLSSYTNFSVVLFLCRKPISEPISSRGMLICLSSLRSLFVFPNDQSCILCDLLVRLINAQSVNCTIYIAIFLHFCRLSHHFEARFNRVICTDQIACHR